MGAFYLILRPLRVFVLLVGGGELPLFNRLFNRGFFFLPPPTWQQQQRPSLCVDGVCWLYGRRRPATTAEREEEE